MKQLRKPKRRITPQREPDIQEAPHDLSLSNENQQPAHAFRHTSTAGLVKAGFDVEFTKPVCVDWEELKKHNNFQEKLQPASKKSAPEDQLPDKNLLSMLGRRGPTRLLRTIMERQDKMFTVRDREYYTRASSGETSGSGSSSESDGCEADEEGAGEDEDKEDEDERPDVGNYDLDDNFIDDSEVVEFFDGLLKRKPKYGGFCIAKGSVTVPVEGEDILRRNSLKINKRRKTKDTRKPNSGIAGRVQAAEKDTEKGESQVALPNNGSLAAEPVMQAPVQPGGTRPDPQPLEPLSQQNVTSTAQAPSPSEEPVPKTSGQVNDPRLQSMNVADILELATRNGADEAMLWAHWRLLPKKSLCQKVFLVLCAVGQEGLSSRDISEKATWMWPDKAFTENMRGRITKFISTYSDGDNPIFRKGNKLYGLQCFPLPPRMICSRKPSKLRTTADQTMKASTVEISNQNSRSNDGNGSMVVPQKTSIEAPLCAVPQIGAETCGQNDVPICCLPKSTLNQPECAQLDNTATSSVCQSEPLSMPQHMGSSQKQQHDPSIVGGDYQNPQGREFGPALEDVSPQVSQNNDRSNLDKSVKL